MRERWFHQWNGTIQSFVPPLSVSRFVDAIAWFLSSGEVLSRRVRWEGSSLTVIEKPVSLVLRDSWVGGEEMDMFSSLQKRNVKAVSLEFSNESFEKEHAQK